jgi:hypothetical protein
MTDILPEHLKRVEPIVIVGPSVGPSGGPVTIDPKYTIVVMSGSTDYLRDETGSQRFWPVQTEPSAGDPEETCDGIHDEDAPALYLCTRCFPNGSAAGGDLATHEDDAYDELRRDDEQEMG